MIKFKNKQSKWMKALLGAEELHKAGWSTDAIRSEFWGSSDDFYNGVLDYCWHIDKVAYENRN